MSAATAVVSLGDVSVPGPVQQWRKATEKENVRRDVRAKKEGPLGAPRNGPLWMSIIAKQIGKAPNWAQALQLARTLQILVYEVVQYYEDMGPDGIKRWKRDWATIRNWVPLQLRLVFEQEFWSRGEPWRSLVSGFRPIEVLDGP